MAGNFHNSGASRGYVLDTPYPDTFFRELAPALLHYAAVINGAPPRDLGAPFAYLELGCGQGGSVITSAGAFPHSRFHACDFNRDHLHRARARADAFGIRNIEFHERSFGELQHAGLPMFDFIVAHGVYSWVSAEDRQAIRHFVRDHLQPGGLLYVSYNSLPGWSSEQPLRKLLLELAAGDFEDTATRAAHALRSLQSLAQQRLRFLEANPSCAAAMRAYAGAPLPYLAHEFLNEDWQPFYGIDLAEQMREADLEYLGSATLADNYPALLVNDGVWESIRKLATERQRRLALDFATNQQFRRDVFWRPPADGGARQRGARQRDDLTFGWAARPDPLPREVRVPRGVLRFEETFVTWLQRVLADGPLTIGAAIASLGSVPARRAEEIRRNLSYLIAAGALAPFSGTGTVARDSKPQRRPWNDTIARILRHCTQHQLDCVLPSELMGNGVRIRPAEAAAALAWSAGDDEADPQLVQWLLHAGILC